MTASPSVSASGSANLAARLTSSDHASGRILSLTKGVTVTVPRVRSTLANDDPRSKRRSFALALQAISSAHAQDPPDRRTSFAVPSTSRIRVRRGWQSWRRSVPSWPRDVASCRGRTLLAGIAPPDSRVRPTVGCQQGHCVRIVPRPGLDRGLAPRQRQSRPTADPQDCRDAPRVSGSPGRCSLAGCRKAIGARVSRGRFGRGLPHCPADCPVVY